MKRAPRRVIVATITGRVVRLAPIPNGSDLTLGAVADLASTAGCTPHRTRGAALLPLSQLPDLEAWCEFRGISVVRREVTR